MTCFKLGKERLDVNDNYSSPWIGGQGGGMSTIGGEGALFVGISGRLNDQQRTPCALGLVALLPKE